MTSALSLESLISILRNLADSDLAQTSCVNSAFYRLSTPLLYSNPQKWQNEKKGWKLCRTLERNPMLAAHVKIVDLACLGGHHDSTSGVFRHLTGVKSVTFGDWKHERENQRFIEDCPAKSIEIVRLDSPTEPICTWLWRQELLSHLSVRDWDSQEKAPDWALLKLKRLVCPTLDLVYLTSSIRELHEYYCFDFGQNSEKDDVSFSSTIASACPHLRFLRLRVRPNQLQDVFHGLKLMPTIQSLYLIMEGTRLNTVVERIRSSLLDLCPPSLTRLHITIGHYHFIADRDEKKLAGLLAAEPSPSSLKVLSELAFQAPDQMTEWYWGVCDVEITNEWG